MAENSHPQGGTRTKGRHAAELGIGGALATFLGTMLPVSGDPEVYGAAWNVLSPFQVTLLVAIFTGAFSTIAKVVDEAGGLAKVLRLTSIVGLIGLAGCAVQLGKVDPKIHTGADGETIVACTVEGVSLSFGDAGVCRNIEGGHVSEAFSGMWTTTMDTARMVVAALFAPFSALGAAGQALGAAPAASFPEPPPETPPAVVYKPDPRADSFVPGTPSWATE